MRAWVGIITAEQLANERLYARDEVTVAGDAGAAPGDPVVLVAEGQPWVLFGHGRVRQVQDAAASVGYRRRLFDDPHPVPSDAIPGGVATGLHPLASTQYTRLSALVDAAAEASAGRSVWFVSVALPIEAASRAEAVREFWTYLDKLGPQELPAYVWPLGDELAMQAFVLGAVANLDPEEDDG
jgi:hypothetical protein